MTVLIVEDDEEQRELRTLLVQRSGFEVIAAGDRRSAKALAQDYLPAAAIIDLRIPTLREGMKLLQELKALCAGMFLIVLTGAMPEVLQTLPESKLIDQLFTKPASTALMLECLRRVADSQQT